MEQRSTTPLRLVVLYVAVAGVYALGARVAFHWFGAGGLSPTFFPAAGITLGALLLTERRSWPAILAGAATAELLVDLFEGSSGALASGWAAANVVEPLVGASLVLAVCGRPDIGRRRDLFGFLAFAVVAGPLVGGAIAATNVAVFASDADWLSYVGHWALGDGLGVLVVGGTLLAFLGRAGRRPLPGPVSIEAVVLSGAAAVATALVFADSDLTWAYVPIVLMPWIAIRHGTRAVAATGLLISFVAAQALVGAPELLGFLSGSPRTGLVHLQVLIGITITTALVLAAEVHERERAVAERTRSQAAERRTARLHQLTAALADERDPERLPSVLTRELATATGAAQAVLYLLEADGTTLRPTRAEGFGPPGSEPRSCYALDADAPLARAARSGRPVLLAAGEAFLPLRGARGPMGAVWLAFQHGLAADADERAFFALLARQAAVALERASLARRERTARLRVQRLQLLASELASAATARQVAEAVVLRGASVLGAETALVALLDAERGCLDVLASSGYACDDSDEWLALATDLEAPGPEAVRTARTVFADSAAEAAGRFRELAAWPSSAASGASLSLPLLSTAGEVCGLLQVQFEAAGPLVADAHAVASTVAGLAGPALERATLLTAEAQARTRAELLTAILAELERVNGFAARAQRLVDLLVPRIADFATVEAPGSAEPVVALAHSDREGREILAALRRRHRLKDADAHSLARVAGGEAHLIARVTPATITEHSLDADACRLLERLGLRSHMAVPLRTGPGPGGELALLLGITDPGRRPYSRDDLAFAELVASRAGLALEGARLYEQERSIAVGLQRALLSDALVEHPAVQIAARYQPGDERLEVGGDWYETIALAEGRIAIAVGDVVGRGLGAAAAMGRLRAGLAALAPGSTSPAELLEQLDRFAMTFEAAHFSTACVAILDPATGRLRHASAGHMPMLLLEPGGSADFVAGGRSWPLCLDEARRRTEGATTIAAGSTLLLFSDGLVERRGEAITDGLDRLRLEAASLATQPVGALCDGLIDRLTRGRVPDDDVVLLAARTQAVVVGAGSATTGDEASLVT